MSHPSLSAGRSLEAGADYAQDNSVGSMLSGMGVTSSCPHWHRPS